MMIQSQGAIDPLSRALDDPDLKVRFYAVRGLALITGEQEWTPNEMDFRADPQRYLKYWKAKMQRP